MTKFILTLVLAVSAINAGALPRSAAEVLAFRRHNPCPDTGKPVGACPGWQVDHTIPLCAGGPDHRSNMAWLTLADHRFKTFIDVRECRKLRRAAATPALTKGAGRGEAADSKTEE